MRLLKYFLVFIFLMITSRANAQDCLDYCPKEKYCLTNSFVRTVQTISGVNIVTSKIVAKIIKKSILKYAKGDIKVKVSSFSMADAKQGKFKRIIVNGKNVNIYSINISEIVAKTKCDWLHVDLKKSPIGLKEPVAADFSAKFSAEDLNNILKSVTYQKYFLSIKMNSQKLNILEISQPEISLKDDKFQLLSRVKVPLMGSFKVKIVSDLKIYNNKIITDDLSILVDNMLLKVKSSKYFIDILNPLWFAQELLQEYDCKILLKNVKISNEMVNINGSFFLSKSKENK